MVLATCIANAYHSDAHAFADAGSSVSALRDWTDHDMEHSPGAIKSLVDAYLQRDYRNPIVETRMPGIRFDLLKCFDLYHSGALTAQVKQFVPQTDEIHRRGDPPARR